MAKAKKAKRASGKSGIGSKKAKKSKKSTSKIVKNKAPIAPKNLSAPEAKNSKRFKSLKNQVQKHVASLPEDIRKNIQQTIFKSSDVLTFGPLKGKKFDSIFRSKHKQFYVNKVFVASNDKEFVDSVMKRFWGIEPLHPEMEIPSFNIGIRKDKSK